MTETVSNLPRSVGAHLGDEDLGPLGQMLVDRPGQTGPVVEAGRSGHHRPIGADHVGDVVLRRGLAVRAGDSHHDRPDRSEPIRGLDNEVIGEPAFERTVDDTGEIDRQRNGESSDDGEQRGRSGQRADHHQDDQRHRRGNSQPGQARRPPER
jgi:hypothetical protein